MRWVICVALAVLATGAASAGTTERDQGWDELMAEVKNHGGKPTTYKTSISYVFHRTGGGYMTFTESQENGVRAVCVLDEGQIVIVCGNWDSQKLRYGWRENAAAAWAYSDTPPAAPEKSVMDSLLTVFHALMDTGAKWKVHRSSEW